MKVTEREELLVQGMNEFCNEQRHILEGAAFLGRAIKKIKALESNDPITVIIDQLEQALCCLRKLTLTIYDAKGKQAIFLEYEDKRYGAYPDVTSTTECRLIHLITKFYADFSMHLNAVDCVINATTHDVKNRIFFPIGLEIPTVLEKLNQIINEYCD